MRDDPTVTELVARARDGDQESWNRIVERYSPLVLARCHRFGLGRADTGDVGGSVWLLLVENLGKLREPAALAGWISTTTTHECLRVLREKKRLSPVDDPELGDSAAPAEDESQVALEELRIALRAAFESLPPECRELLSLLFDDPPATYQVVSETLGMPRGAIGPNRGRCLDRMRRHRAMVPYAPGALSGERR